MKTSALKRAKILLFGDSITQQSFGESSCGWGACIADRYQRRADVLNRGYSGYNTDWFLKLAATDSGRSDLFDHENVMLVTIFFGANDASDPALNGRQHVPLDRYESNIGDIISLTRSNFGEGVGILLISPPPVCHEGRLRFQKEAYGDGASGKLERSLELSGTYAQGAATLAALSFVLGLGLGSGQPVVLSLLHEHAPRGRVGEVVGVRMSLIQSMAVAVPLIFGALGTSLGLVPVFWAVGACLGASGWYARRTRRAAPAR